MEKARSMLSDVGLGHKFWVVAINTTRYLKKKSPTLMLVYETPHELCSGKKPFVPSL